MIPRMARKKLPRGRPPLPPDVRKEVTLRIRMSSSLREALDRAAQEEKTTASDLVRKLVESKLGVS